MSPTRCCPRTGSSSWREVVEQGGDLGIAWDGDADRCFFIDEQGAFVDGDFLTALLTASMLEKEPGGDRPLRRPGQPGGGRHGARGRGRGPRQPRRPRLLQDPDASGGRRFRRRGLRPLLLPRLLLRGLGTLPALLILELLSRRDATLSELLERYRSRYFISGEINSEVADPEAKLEELAKRYNDGRQSRLDGVSIDYDDWHFNVRPSNTEPLLRLCLESLRSREHMEAKRDEVLSVIRS